jgi:S1-C subfamily serine protease
MGDIILGYQGAKTESAGQFLALLEWMPPQGQVVLDVLRNGQIIQVVLDMSKTKGEEKTKAQPTSI